MDNKNNKRKEPWRIVIGIIAIIYIIGMWIQKDIISIYSTMPIEDAIPLIATTVVVSVVKVVLLTGFILLVKWIVKKFNRNKKETLE